MKWKKTFEKMKESFRNMSFKIIHPSLPRFSLTYGLFGSVFSSNSTVISAMNFNGIASFGRKVCDLIAYLPSGFGRPLYVHIFNNNEKKKFT